VQLLQQLGYKETGQTFRHPNRLAVFCGDFVDRGPQIADTVQIVRAMVQDGAAHAVMGNHEFNAIAFHTKCPDEPDRWYRPHTTRHTHQHQATLDQLNDRELSETLDWFRQLPVALDLGPIRVVHACWDADGIKVLEEALKSHGGCDTAFLANAADTEHPVRLAVERVLKGPEVELPNNTIVTDKEGHARRRVRIRWFESPTGHSLGSYAFPHVPRLKGVPVPNSVSPSPYGARNPPLFVGHYWLDSRHNPLLLPNLACLDLSVARGGMLCAYRFNGEVVLNPASFVKVPARNMRTVP